MNDSDNSRSRVIFGGAVVCVIVALRLIFIVDPVVGPIATYTAVLAFFAHLWNMVDAPAAARSAYSDPDGPNQGFDPRTIEAARRRAEGIG